MIISFKRLLLICLTFLIVYNFAQGKKVMTFKDVMKFEKINEYGLSDYGNLFFYTADPDRGDSELFLKNLKKEKEFQIKRGTKGKFSNDEKWFSCLVKPELIKTLNSKKDKPENDLIIMNSETGDTVFEKSVKNFDFTEDSKWLAVHFNKSKKTDKKDKFGSKLNLRNLSSNKTTTFQFVTSYSIDTLSNYLAYSVSDTSKNNGVYLVDLNQPELKSVLLDTLKNGNYNNLIWNNKSELVFTRSKFVKKEKTEEAELFLWNGQVHKLVSTNQYPENWIIPIKNKISWAKSNDKIFFGFKPCKKDVKKSEEVDSADIYNFENILADKTLDVWHWDDPLIKTNEKEEFKKNKNKTYTAVYNLSTGKFIQLSDEELPVLYVKEDEKLFLGKTTKPYDKLKTWDGTYSDYYVINPENGEKTKIAEKLYDDIAISYDGEFVVYFDKNEWYLYNTVSEKTHNITENIDVMFENEDHDFPRNVDSYGFGGWIDGSKYFLIYDKFDIWKVNSKTIKAVNITKGEGRKNTLQFRIYKTDKKAKYFKSDEELLIKAYNDEEKYTATYKLNLKNNELKKLSENHKKYTFKTKAEKSDKIVFTRESYREYPDFWITDLDFDSPEKITDLGKQVNEYKWGIPELIEWLSSDGEKLKGILIKPEGFDPNKKYPVLVYYYRFFTPRMYDFPDIVVNHRPNYGVYSSHDYVIFLPDIKFEIGRPGISAVKCLVPGIHKLIEMGIADPNAVGLHGHSWSGYQTAFVVTQTDIFRCAVAGAPVSNMTSAYSGIRWGTGLARQFQYEKAQSRIGASLFEAPHLYIENSPVFFAERINTPLLLQHGDMDEAVPWYQSIELYLAMRRLNKDCIFLQYRDELHHLKKYPNKLDYSIKMKEYFDYHLKGDKPAEWILNGIPYTN